MSNDVIIGELLVRAGLIDSSALAQAREVQKKDGTSLARALETLRLADGEAVSAAIAESLHLELLRGDMPEVLPEVVALLPGDFCRKRLIVPLSVEAIVCVWRSRIPWTTRLFMTWNFAPASALWRW